MPASDPRLWGALVVGLGSALGVSSPAVSQAAPAAAPGITSTSTGQSAQPGRAPKRPKAIASYELLARLDTEEHVVRGEGKIRWTNPAEVDATEIYLHLYLNAFKNDKSLFLRSPFGAGRSGDRAIEYGYVQVQSLTLEGAESDNLWSKAEWESAEDTTDARVPLPSPVAPGETITLELSFESKLPKIVERTGYSKSYHFVAQWFPKVAKREADGSWAHFPYHPQSEYYADFGNYRVTIEAPEDFVVGATGKLTSREPGDGVQRLTFEEESIHDFAFTAWDEFVKTHANIAGVKVELLHPPGYELAEQVTRDVLEQALPHFNRRYGRYPYSTLTVVHPPDHAENSGGMEYPTLITTGSPWFAPYVGVRALEAVTVHELGHQWFYGLLASNEHAWPFLDEGVNSYAEGVALDEFYGQGSLLNMRWLQVSMPSVTRPLSIAFGQDEVVGQAAQEFTSFRSLGAHVYNRTATILDTAARVYGRDELDEALASYTRDQRFSHPTPMDLLASLDAHLGAAATRNLRRAIFERGRVDYTVTSLQSVQDSQAAGWFEGASEPTLPDSDEPPSDAPWLSRVVVARRGNLEFPVTVRLEFEDGSRVDKHWSGRGETYSVTHRGPARLVAATVDPERRVRLDEDLLNNTQRERSRWVPRVWERAVYYAGLVLSMLGV